MRTRLSRHLPMLLGTYAILAAVLGSTAVLFFHRRSAGVDAHLGQLLAWQTLTYLLWVPVAWVGAAVLKKETALRRILPRWMVLAVISAPGHSILAAQLDMRFSAAPKPLLPTFMDRLPIDILAVTAIIAAVAALETWRRSTRLEEALAKARTIASASEDEATPDEAPLLVSTGQRQIPVPRAAVESFGAAGNYVVVNWDGSEGLVRGTLKEFEERLNKGHFARCHRSAIVNLAKVSSASALSDGSWRLQMESGAEVIVSRTYRDQILQRLGRKGK